MTRDTAARAAGKIAINATIPIAAVIAAVGWVANHGVDVFDLRYEQKADAITYRADLKYQHTRDSANAVFQHTTDSLIYVVQLNEMKRDIKALIADCQRRGGCQ